jgi:hypothetical protein
LEVSLLDAEFDHIGEALDQSCILVLLLQVTKDRIQALQVVLPVIERRTF